MILRPSLQKRYLELEDPTLEDQASDLERVLREIDDLELTASLDVLRKLGPTLRSSNFQVTAVISDNELIDVEPGDTTASRHGMAFDLGTTTVVATLLDLGTGTPVAVASMLNKQQPFGADVITRISATMLDPEALGRLRDRAQETLAELAAEVCQKGGIDPAAVYEVALAGNATMTQLVLGMDPSRSASRRSSWRRARSRRCAHRISASRCTPARPPTSSRRSAPTSAATSWPASSPPA